MKLVLTRATFGLNHVNIINVEPLFTTLPQQQPTLRLNVLYIYFAGVTSMAPAFSQQAVTSIGLAPRVGCAISMISVCTPISRTSTQN